MTEKPTDSTSLVVVIYNECPRMCITHCKIFLMTNSACKILYLCHVKVLLYCKAVITL